MPHAPVRRLVRFPSAGERGPAFRLDVTVRFSRPRVLTEDGAREIAYRFLARASRSTSEMRGYLERQGFARAHVEAAIGALKSGRYLDDAALAERRAEELMVRRGWGRLKVASELTRRGFADSVVSTAIHAVHDEHDETELARAALHRKYSKRPLGSTVERARAFRYLTGRGHPVDIVTHVLGDTTED